MRRGLVLGLTLLLMLRTLAWAAPAPTSLTTGVTNTDNTVFTTASVSIQANTLITFCVGSRLVSGTTVTDPTASGLSATWVIIDKLSGGSDPSRYQVCFRTMSGSSQSGTVTVTFTETMTQAVWNITEWTGVDTGGTNGSAAIVQFKTATAACSSCTVTLDSALTSGNRPFAAFVSGTGSAGATPETNWTELFDLHESSVLGAGEWKDADDDNSASYTFATSTQVVMVMMEIKAAAGGGGGADVSARGLLMGVH